MHLDTSFVIDFLREAARGQPGAATRWLEGLAADEELVISVFVACELAAGAERSRRPTEERERVRRLCAQVRVAHPDDRFPAVYGRVLGQLEREGQRIAVMDLLIATAALLEDAPLATANGKDFARVPGLRLVEYRG